MFCDFLYSVRCVSVSTVLLFQYLFHEYFLLFYYINTHKINLNGLSNIFCFVVLNSSINF